jgi:hypothetical protein
MVMLQFSLSNWLAMDAASRRTAAADGAIKASVMIDVEFGE